MLKDWLKFSKPSSKILDLGSATGGNTLFMKSLGFELTSVELSDLGCLIQRAKGISVVQADARELPFPACSFDIVVCLDLLEHIREDWKVVTEIHRVLIPGGLCIIAVPEDMSMWSDHDLSVDHVRRYSTREIKDLCLNSGFAIDAVWHSNIILKPLARIQRRMSKGSALKEINPYLNRFMHFFATTEYRIFRKIPSGLTVWVSLQKQST